MLQIYFRMRLQHIKNVVSDDAAVHLECWPVIFGVETNHIHPSRNIHGICGQKEQYVVKTSFQRSINGLIFTYLRLNVPNGFRNARVVNSGMPEARFYSHSNKWGTDAFWRFNGKSTSERIVDDPITANESENDCHEDSLPVSKGAGRTLNIAKQNNSMYDANKNGFESSKLLLQGSSLSGASLTAFSSFGYPRLLLRYIYRLGLLHPTAVQTAAADVIYKRRSALIIAPSGSGKTLAFLLPVLSNLLISENDEIPRVPMRPRCLILVSSRELALQLYQRFLQPLSPASAVEICRKSKNAHNLSGNHGLYGKGKFITREFRRFAAGAIHSCLCTGGGSYNAERKSLRCGVDIVIATPSRVLLHLHKGNIQLQQVKHVIVDEADTLADEQFEGETRTLLDQLYPYRHQPDDAMSQSNQQQGGPQLLPQLIFAAATKTGALQCFLDAYRPHYRPGGTNDLISSAEIKGDCSENGIKIPEKANRYPNTLHDILDKIVTPGAHGLPLNLQQVFIPAEGGDKLQKLFEIIGPPDDGKRVVGSHDRELSTIIFCNTVSTCRAVQWGLQEKGYDSACIHGELPFKLRSSEYKAFLHEKKKFLVCTDICARGLDFLNVARVILLDFPPNVPAFLHRAGRTARGGAGGTVISFYSRKNEHMLKRILHAIAEVKADNIVPPRLEARIRSHLVYPPVLKGKKDEATSGILNKTGGERVPNLSFVSRRAARVLHLERKWQDILAMKNRKRKIGGRKAQGLPPRRGLVGPETRRLLQKQRKRNKMLKQLQELRTRGRLGKKQLIPRRPDIAVQQSDSQTVPKIVRGTDGSLQMFAAKRNFLKNSSEEEWRERGKYEDESLTIPVNLTKTNRQEFKIKGIRNRQKPLF